VEKRRNSSLLPLLLVFTIERSLKIGESVLGRRRRIEKPKEPQVVALICILLQSIILKNKDLPTVQPLSDVLFRLAKPELNKINNILALEKSLYSEVLGIAGTVDCIAEYDGELAIIDFKTSKKPKPVEWIEHYFVQCMAYGCMLYELTGISVKKTCHYYGM